MEVFVQWFQSYGAYLDISAMGIFEFPPSEGGRGAIALKDIPNGHVLFTIPRNLTLSTRTSQLPSTFGLDAWRKAKLHQGWAGLILCMMWERAQSPSSKWAGYLDTLPEWFDTPMFWNEDDLTELKGTSVVEKLGKTEAEVDFNERLVPAVKSRPDLFRPEDLPTHYTLGIYHIMGSRILSRSFVVEKWEGDEDEDETPGEAANASMGSAMDVDGQDHDQEKTGDAEDSEDAEDEDDSSDVAMVPMADILNARYQTENAKLFYEKEELRMVTTKPIKSGEQIWNTYGDLPNAELLRRYGHVDILPLPSGGSGNPGDVVEVKADLIVSAVSSRPEAAKGEAAKERIEWWLEEGGEDIFVLGYDLEVPPVMNSFAKVLLLSPNEWGKVQEKSKPPKPKLEGVLYDILISTLESRLVEYPTTLEADKALLSESLPLNKRQALIVRIGEKAILQGTLEKLKNLKEADGKRLLEVPNKRKAGASTSTAKTKKSRH
ncbi:SET domain-containing protein [Macrolepiota fuliginosa MF-IS2]|uniref:Ribosomal lysine N-methyltransferase 4 n=1 Tax=Macrolepiota fuliginosa MF-IS2 TaxID=1400762 RepID=A0A9P5XJX8_9AGAR|nr:SET domain-containing protein [Macrolepiota fuliginosa MF-IS2]